MTTNWKTPAEQLCRAVAPHDLSGRPAYLVDAGDVGAYEPHLTGGDCAGWTNRVADLMLCDFLHTQQQWQGRGFAAVIHPNRCDGPLYLLGCVLHELAHHLCYPIGQSVETPREVSIELLSWIPDKWTEPQTTKTIRLPPWHQHDANFVRTCCHLSYRAGQHTEAIRPRHLMFATQYFGQPFTEGTFIAAIGDEPDRLAAVAIRDILKTPAPDSFDRAWNFATQWFTDSKDENGTTQTI